MVIFFIFNKFENLNLSLLKNFIDLKKFRTYNGVSVRDLLRAIRNKVY